MHFVTKTTASTADGSSVGRGGGACRRLFLGADDADVVAVLSAAFPRQHEFLFCMDFLGLQLLAGARTGCTGTRIPANQHIHHSLANRSGRRTRGVQIPPSPLKMSGFPGQGAAPVGRIGPRTAAPSPGTSTGVFGVRWFDVSGAQLAQGCLVRQRCEDAVRRCLSAPPEATQIPATLRRPILGPDRNARRLHHRRRLDRRHRRRLARPASRTTQRPQGAALRVNGRGRLPRSRHPQTQAAPAPT